MCKCIIKDCIGKELNLGKGKSARPFVFVGVSLGCWLAVEISRQLKEEYQIVPVFLWLSNLLPPTADGCLPKKDKLIKDMTDSEVKDYTIKFGADGLANHWASFSVPITCDMGLLDDFHKKWHNNSQNVPMIQLNGSTQIRVLYSEDDNCVPDPSNFLSEWQKALPGNYKEQMLKGQNHCWLVNSSRDDVFAKELIPDLDSAILHLEYA